MKLRISLLVAFPSGDIRLAKSNNLSIPFTPEPAVVNVGDCEIVFTRTLCSRTSVEDLSNVFKTSMDILGGQIDFVLHSIGMSPNG